MQEKYHLLTPLLEYPRWVATSRARMDFSPGKKWIGIWVWVTGFRLTQLVLEVR